MKIDSAYVGMESARQYKSSTSTRVSCAVDAEYGYDTGSQLASFTNFLPTGADPGKEEEENQQKVPSDRKTQMDNAVVSMNQMGHATALELNSKSAAEKFRKLHELCIRRIFEMLFGKRSCDKICDEESLNEDAQIGQQSGFMLVSQNYHIEETYEESEFTSFATTAKINTADGRSVDLNINLFMSRSFSAEYEERYSENVLMKFTDPLVLNFDSDMPDVKDLSFFFDLDCDGKEEKISGFGKGSGFLALDKNGDGVINDGSELFGTESGDGFKDLSLYDEDQNGWIDENDSIFESLRVWVKGENGDDILYSLKDKNIGAICLNNVNTGFAITDGSQIDATAMIRKTGFYLYEDMSYGTMMHIDLVS